MNIDRFQDAQGVPHLEPLRITHTKATFTNADAMILARPDVWHKFILYDIENLEKKEILEALVGACEPEVLLPVMYSQENKKKATFIAKCNIPMVENLVRRGLQVKINAERTIRLDMVLGFANVEEVLINPQRSLNQALFLRHDATKKILNLDKFASEKTLRHIHVSMSSPAVLTFIKHCYKIRASSFMPSHSSKMIIQELSLRSNGLKGRLPFDKFFNDQLRKLHLGDNEISDIDELRGFAEYKITELSLDGNPLCSRYSTAEEYIRDVKRIFPHLEKLDGIALGSDAPAITQFNYLGEFPRTQLIKQFIRHFYTFYDQDDRIVMRGLYDSEALFSMTLGAIANPTHNQMTKAFANNRNLLKFVDYAKCHEFLLRGPEKILAALRRQPATYHDYKNFNVDVLHSTNDSMTLIVQGYFCYKEYPYSPLFFNRTFVIVEAEDMEYLIFNDLYHIQSDTLSAKNPAIAPKVAPVDVPKIEPTIFGPSEKEQMLKFFINRTTMNRNFSRCYLDEADWNFQVALAAFIKDYTVNNVPPQAFSESSQ